MPGARTVHTVGGWRAAVADDALRRTYAEPGCDDDAWAPVPATAHWRTLDPFAASDGPLLYRATLGDLRGEGESGARGAVGSGAGGAVGSGAVGPGDRTWLVLDGIFYTSDVWFDGAYLGDTEGYFFPHEFEITDAVADRSEHVLALEVACTPQRDRAHKRNLTGVFQHWDLIDQAWNPGGIWRPTRILRTGPVRILHSRVLCRDATAEAATVFVRLVLDAPEACTTTIVSRVRRHADGGEVTEHRHEQPLAAGENQVELTFVVEEPDLWWPWSRGEQPRYDVEVAVHLGDGADGGPDAGGAGAPGGPAEGGASDTVTRTIGLRSVSVDDWVFSINGERLFLKGANQGPSRFALADAEPERMAADIALAKDAGLDMLRLHAHISRPEVYDAADAAGLLLWQDLPLQWGYHRSVRKQARRQARLAVDVLAHHPSVFLWCGHNEPMAIDIEPTALADPKRRVVLGLRGLAQQMLPTWNKSVLDRSVKRVLEACDGSRPVVPHSGVLPHPPLLDGTDSHWYFGWYHGETVDVARMVRLMPSTARFMSEFGAQAVPLPAPWVEPERWPDLDWPALAQTFALQKTFFDRHVPPAGFPTFEAWAEATQRYQAELLRFHIETLRRIKYRPTGGFALFCFADSAPGVTWSIVDDERRPKAAYAAVQEACRPTIITADPLPAVLETGRRLRLDVHAVNDRPIALSDMLASAHLQWGSGGVEGAPPLVRRWEGTLPADTVVLVGTLDVVVPAGATSASLDLALTGTLPDGSPLAVTNRYACPSGSHR